MERPRTVQQVWQEAAQRGIDQYAKMTPAERAASRARLQQQMLSLRGWDKKPRVEERPKS